MSPLWHRHHWDTRGRSCSCRRASYSRARLRAGDKRGSNGVCDDAAARPGNRGGDGAGLDEHAAEVEVLVAVWVAVAWELEDTEMPVGAVGGGRARDGGDAEGERVGAGGMPEGDGIGGEVLLIFSLAWC